MYSQSNSGSAPTASGPRCRRSLTDRLMAGRLFAEQVVVMLSDARGGASNLPAIGA
jgi:hypothetical protein